MKVDILINKDGKETVFIQSNTFRKGKGSISPQLWFKYYYSSPSTRMALALDNPRRLTYS